MHPKLNETLSKYKTIVFVGGGTGGHISPIVSLSRELREQDGEQKLLWLGGSESEEEHTAREYGIDFETIPTLKLSTTRSPRVALYPLVLLHGIWTARKILRNIYDEKHVAVFSKGGPGSVAVGIAAWTLGIPLYIHESDTIPGTSNRILSRFATQIFVGFESARRFFAGEKIEVIGQILDPILSNGTKKGKIHWKTKKKHILVLCGSQGSKAIFEEIIRSCSHIDVEWMIVLGRLNMEMRHDFDHFSHIHILDWIEKEDQRDVFQMTDIAITRGSATTLAELDMFEVRKIIIPLPLSAGDHQYYNAEEYGKKGDILLEQKNLKQLAETLHTIGPNSKLSKK